MADETNPKSERADSAPTDETGAPVAAPLGELDPLGWEVPVICKDCDQPFKVPYRHFQTGVVFHCPQCHGSFVPKLQMYRSVREVFETFYAKRRHDQEEFARSGGDTSTFQRKQEGELQAFHQALDKLAHEMRPAGKMVKPKGLAAMFT
jgi:hypothetical protein